ncbi:hypothetical protein BGX26_003283, partial [Mortierella sp. AD094]
MATRLEPLLANASLLAATLTAIRIEKFKAEQVLYIDQILNACENLIDLHLESPTLPKRYGILDPGFGGITSIGLREALFELPPLYHLIVRCLPSLEHIHVSFISDVMRPNDAVVFRQVFDSVKSWSFAHEDLESSNLELILMPTKPEDPLHELTFPILTSLDIQNGSSATDLPEALHAYLVSPAAASLVHLKASYIPYWRPTPTQKLKRRLWVARLRLQLNANQDPVPSDAQMQVDPVDGTVPRISSLGSLEDLIECLEDDNGSSGGGAHPDNLGNVGCLPCLESLVIERSG